MRVDRKKGKPSDSMAESTELKGEIPELISKNNENDEAKARNASDVNAALSETSPTIEGLKSGSAPYTLRDEYTTENYKIEIRNLGYFATGALRKLLREKLKLDVSKLKCPNSRDFAFVCFRSKEDQLRGLTLLNGYKWKNKTLQAVMAKPTMDPLLKRRLDELEFSELREKNRNRTSVEATCPLASQPYEDQLRQKNDEMQKVLDKFNHELMQLNMTAESFVRHFEYKGISASPQVDGYRNKNEFTVGTNPNGDAVVGFRLGTYANGCTEVGSIDEVTHIPHAAKWAAYSFQEFVRQSRFKPFDPVTNGGHFRQLMVRTSTSTGEIMIVVGIYSSNLTSKELTELKESLINYYDNLQGEFTCSSLYYQDVKQRRVGQMVNPVEHLSGKKQITDRILDLDFVISPLAFFQVNTAAASVLYKKIIDLAAPKVDKTTILDICCGTGTIGLSFAKHCRKVIGVDIIPEAIEDALCNADKNGIKNCTFYAGNADDFISSMAREAAYDHPPTVPFDLTAIVDPPRAGLHNRSIIALRAASHIKRIVYVSCNPARAYKNWLDLGRPESKQYRGDPFMPRYAASVDMFPHTLHTEMVIVLERSQNNILANRMRTQEELKNLPSPTAVVIIDDENESETDATDSTETKVKTVEIKKDSCKRKHNHCHKSKAITKAVNLGAETVTTKTTNANVPTSTASTESGAAASEATKPKDGEAEGGSLPAKIAKITPKDREEARRQFEATLVDEEPDEIPLA